MSEMQPNMYQPLWPRRRPRLTSHSLRFTPALHERCTKTLRRRLDITMGTEGGSEPPSEEGDESAKAALIAISRQ